MLVHFIKIVRHERPKIIKERSLLTTLMIDDQTILLQQILEELKQQNQYLFDLRQRLESFESTMDKDLTHMESAIGSMRVRGVIDMSSDGRMGIVGCPILEDEIVYILNRDRGSAGHFVVEDEHSENLLRKLRPLRPDVHTIRETEIAELHKGEGRTCWSG